MSETGELENTMQIPSGNDDVAQISAAAPLKKMHEKPQKDIHKTIGGRIVDTFIYYGIGFIANSALSLTLTYYFNPRPGVKKAKDSIARGITGVFKGADYVRTLDNARNFVETSFMVCSGFLTTAIMMPLLPRREKMAHTINKWLKRDAHVLPEEMRDKKIAVTLEDRVNQEVDQRINKKQNNRDLWIARCSGIGIFMGADAVLNRMDRALESSGKYSITTSSWLAGQKLFSKLPHKWPHKINDWFSRHGASLNELKTNAKEHFQRLEKAEIKFAETHHLAINPDRMVIAEQSRLLIKEVSWTLIVAWMVRGMTGMLRNHRVHKEQEKAVSELCQEGLIPKGYNVVIGERIKLEPKEPDAQAPEQKTASWSEKQKPSRPVIEKSTSHIQLVETRKDNAYTAIAT